MVAVCGPVVVELDPDEIHLLHGGEGDRGVGAGALRGAGEVELSGGVRGEFGAEGGDEGGVAGWVVAFVV